MEWEEGIIQVHVPSARVRANWNRVNWVSLYTAHLNAKREAECRVAIKGWFVSDQEGKDGREGARAVVTKLGEVTGISLEAYTDNAKWAMLGGKRALVIGLDS